MMEREKRYNSYFHDSLGSIERIEKQLATEFGLEQLRSGSHVIRNEKGWRENEKEIEYVWIVRMSRSFVGWGGLFSIRFNESKFQEHDNPNELVKGIFIDNKDGIDKFYFDIVRDTTDNVAEILNFNLFEANKGIALDGVSYSVRIIARNIDTFIHLNNPNSGEWKEWEKMVWAMGRDLAERSGNNEMIQLFE